MSFTFSNKNNVAGSLFALLLFSCAFLKSSLKSCICLFYQLEFISHLNNMKLIVSIKPFLSTYKKAIAISCLCAIVSGCMLIFFIAKGGSIEGFTE